jgi:hypothetical protein
MEILNSIFAILTLLGAFLAFGSLGIAIKTVRLTIKKLYKVLKSNFYR